MDLPSYMHSFLRDAQKQSENPNQPPNAISGTALDGNFAACLPLKLDGNNTPYKVKADSQGWLLQPTVVFDVCENGKARKYKFFAERVGTKEEGDIDT